MVRWRVTHVGEQPTLREAMAAFVSALSCCWCFGSWQRPNPDIRIFNDVESGGHEGEPVDGDTASRTDGQAMPNQIPGSTARLSPSGATTSLQVNLSIYGQILMNSWQFDVAVVSGMKSIRSVVLIEGCAPGCG